MTDEEYRWQLVDDFINAFNKHRAATFEPGSVICIDEPMVRWYGLGGHWISVGLPHYVAIDRKPKDGCKILDSCCANVGILCQLRLVKTVTDEERAERAHTPAGTRAALLLTKPWHGTCRTIVGDT